jgi:hypothetical protein
MLKKVLFAGGVLVTVGLFASTSLARPISPKKANKYQATVVTGVEACSAANTTAPGALMTAACDPVVASDSVCQFTEKAGKPKGGGKVLAKAKDDIKINVKVKGITETCNGETLCAVASVRTSTNNCASTGDCSTIPQPDLPLGIACCLVEKQKCKIKTTVNTALPGALVTGNSTEFIIGEVGLKRTGGGVAFRAGLLLP